MSHRYITKNGRTSKRGAFISGIWHCDCEPRMPADKFKTKNGGKNHGRWFYTCQKPQHKRCPFFLWADEAKVREESAVLKNSRSEPQAPQTPRKPNLLQPATPTSRPKLLSSTKPPATTPTKQTSNGGKKEEFDWSSSDNDELVSTVDSFQTPRKTPRTSTITSPSKRTRADMTAVSSDDVFTTPATSSRSHNTGLLSPSVTPSYSVQHHPDTSTDESSLAARTLSILSPAKISPDIESQLIDLLNKADLRLSGAIKGRELTRLALAIKDKKIADLQSRLEALETERETSRNVIALLKNDMATSPKRGLPKPRRYIERTRSTV